VRIFHGASRKDAKGAKLGKEILTADYRRYGKHKHLSRKKFDVHSNSNMIVMADSESFHLKMNLAEVNNLQGEIE
jgi:hypothetical protein